MVVEKYNNMRLLLLLLFCSIFAGCSSINDVYEAKGSGIAKTYEKPKNQVWLAMKKALVSTGGTVEEEHEDECMLFGEYGMGLGSYGERVGIFCYVIAKDKTRAEVVSKRKMKTNLFAPDWANPIFKELDLQLIDNADRKEN